MKHFGVSSDSSSTEMNKIKSTLVLNYSGNLKTCDEEFDGKNETVEFIECLLWLSRERTYVKFWLVQHIDT